MFVNCQTEIFYRILDRLNTSHPHRDINSLVDESDKLMEYSNRIK